MTWTERAGLHRDLESAAQGIHRWQPSTLLVGASDEHDAASSTPTSASFPAPGAVVRRVIPTLVEATLIPALLVYGFVALGFFTLAMVSALAWTCGVLAWRRLTRRSIPGVLLLAAAGLFVSARRWASHPATRSSISCSPSPPQWCWPWSSLEHS